MPTDFDWIFMRDPYWRERPKEEQLAIPRSHPTDADETRRLLPPWPGVPRAANRRGLAGKPTIVLVPPRHAASRGRRGRGCERWSARRPAASTGQVTYLGAGVGFQPTRRDDAVSPEPTAAETIVLIHGFWVTPRSWEHWVAR